MTIDKVLVEILSETVSALNLLDLDKLQDLENRMIKLADKKSGSALRGCEGSLGKEAASGGCPSQLRAQS
jgi:hypothetical protein